VSRPRPDELEISVLGRGFGESLLIHVGSGAWVVVDSFRDESGEPAPLSYLETFASPDRTDRVVAVVITHWDDDHTRGMAEIIAAHSPAEVWMPAVLDNDEAFEFAVTHDMATRSSPVPSGLREFVAVAEQVGDDTRMWGIRGRAVATGTDATIRLLSPHDAVASRGFAALGITQQPGFGELSSPEPNNTSIALWVSWTGRRALLGADLENGRWGWQAIVASWPEAEPTAYVLKVPHHGSPDAHYDGMYEQMCDRNAAAAVTRYTRGAAPRPSDDDRNRVRPLVGAGWVVGAEGPGRRSSTPEELHEESTTIDGLWYPRGPIGHLQIRCDAAGTWTSQTHGTTEVL
jgi:hypothetical protein